MWRIDFFAILILFSCILSKSYTQDCIDRSRIDTAWAEDAGCYKNLNIYVDYIVPFCGCNDRTYLNSICASSIDGVIKEKDGGCNCYDPAIIDLLKWNYYAIEKHSYNYSRAYLPVCGCDNKTYFNQADAYYRGGIKKWSQGPCLSCIDTSLILDKDRYASYYEEIMDPDKYSPICGCDSMEYYNKEVAVRMHGITKFSNTKCVCKDATLIDTSLFCDQLYNPVCGCDSITYFNECIAKTKFGISKFRNGRCICPLPELIDEKGRCFGREAYYTKIICGCDSITYPSECIANKFYGITKIKDGPCKCVNLTNIDTTTLCPIIFKPVCGCDSIMYQNICSAKNYFGISDFIDSTEKCRCENLKVINTKLRCGNEINPVCGCDGKTYINECVAVYHNGVMKFKPGPCNMNCKDSIYIDLKLKCSDTISYVCGCDSVTYDNECIAYYKNGVTSWRKGHCDSLVNTSYLGRVSLNIYPNPAIDNLVVECNNYPIQSLTISTFQNIEILKNQGYQNKIITDISHLPRGIYIIRVYINSENFFRKILLN